jgi:hypothetical protein
MPTLFNRIKQLGLIGVLKVYRDWSQPDSVKWCQVAQEYKMEAIQCFRQPHKQSTDIYMITDILNDLWSLPKNDIVIMITCDSDFNHLCHQILKMGKKLIIIGKDSSIANICYQFWNINDFIVVKNANKKMKINHIPTDNINYQKEDLTEETSQENTHIFFNEESNSDEIFESQIDNITMFTDIDIRENLIKCMNNKYIMKLSEVKKELKKYAPLVKLFEKDFSKYKNDFLLIKNKSKILVLYIPEILIKKCNKKKKDISKLITDKYPEILKHIKMDPLINLIY